ncbi:MAG: YncE family protein [Cuniculiplasma sp.]
MREFRGLSIKVIILSIALLLIIPIMIPVSFNTSPFNNRSTGLEHNDIRSNVTNSSKAQPFNMSRYYNPETYVFSNSSFINGYYCNHGNTRQPYDSIYDPHNHLLYLVKYLSSELCIVNLSTETLVSQVNVNTEASCLVYSPINNRIFISSICNDQVAVLNPTTERIVKNISVGIGTCSMALSPKGNVLYAFNEFSKNISVINVSSCRGTGSIRTKYDPTGGITDFNGSIIYAITNQTSNLCIINASTEKVLKDVNTGALIKGITCDSLNGNVYISSILGPDIACFNSHNLSFGNRVQTPLDGKIVFCASNDQIYISDGFTNGFSYLNIQGMIMGKITNVSNFPVSYTLIPSDHLIVTDNYLSCTVTFLNFSTFSIVKTLNTTYSPYSSVYCNYNGYLYVTQKYRDNVLVLELSTMKLISTIPVQGTPTLIKINPFNGEIYVLNSLSDSVTVISPMNDDRTANITLGQNPSDLAFNPHNGTTYVSSCQSINISAIRNNSTTVNYVYRTGFGIREITYDARNSILFAANGILGSVSAISTINQKIFLNPIEVQNPDSLVYCQSNGIVYISNESFSITLWNSVTGIVTHVKTPGFLGRRLFRDSFKKEIFYLTYNREILVYSDNKDSPSAFINSTFNQVCLSFAHNGREIVITDTSQGVVNMLIPRETYGIRVMEYGLSANVPWYFNITGLNNSQKITNNSYSVFLPPGTYNYTAQSSDKVYNSSLRGEAILTQRGLNLSISFTPNIYSVCFRNSEFSSGVRMSVKIDNLSKSSTNSNIYFNLPNGSYIALVELNLSNGNLLFLEGFTVHGRNVSLIPNISLHNENYNVFLGSIYAILFAVMLVAFISVAFIIYIRKFRRI